MDNEMVQEKHTPQIRNFVITGSVHEKIEDRNDGLYFYPGKNVVKVTIEIEPGYSSSEVMESLKDMFQRTIQSFQQFL